MKIQHNLTDYLGCEFHMNKERTRGWLGQPSIIKSLEQKFGDRVMKERLSLTPGTPRFTARRLENPEDKVKPEEHETYRSVVGTLLNLTKHSRPDICNPVRELSKTIDAPAPVHLKEMYKVIRPLGKISERAKRVIDLWRVEIKIKKELEFFQQYKW